MNNKTWTDFVKGIREDLAQANLYVEMFPKRFAKNPLHVMEENAGELFYYMARQKALSEALQLAERTEEGFTLDAVLENMHNYFKARSLSFSGRARDMCLKSASDVMIAYQMSACLTEIRYRLELVKSAGI